MNKKKLTKPTTKPKPMPIRIARNQKQKHRRGYSVADSQKPKGGSGKKNRGGASKGH